MLPPSQLPVLFVSHGAPTLALDAERGGRLRRWAEALERPRAILAVSAHWESPAPRLGTTSARELLYDFGGFPEALYRLRYAAPPAPELAERVRELLGGRVEDAPTRPWDHGVWVPLLHMFPEADVPLVQLSLPRAAGAELVELGRALRALRSEDTLILCSGGAVHNLRQLDWRGGEETPAWALEFEAWLRAALREGEVDALAEAPRRAPGFAAAHPTPEHFLPLLIALGAGQGDEVRFPVEGWEFGSLSHLGVQFG